MLFSCKISSAVLTYLEAQNEDLSALLEGTSLPEEFLRDPSYWMKASEMEDFLAAAQSLTHDDGPLFSKVGHAGPNLRSWGVLDSVLRMMPRPQEILAQPQRFISYFVSPEPPVEKVVRTENSIEFDLPISTDIYPLVTQYLQAAFDSLPVYVGQSLAVCEWSGIHIRYSWSQESSMFIEDPGHQISPELLRSVVSSLEVHQKELEEKNRDLQSKNESLQKIHQELEEKINPLPAALPELEFIDGSSVHLLKNNFAKLNDYMVRAQQLITMLIAQDRLNPAVKAAMKKTDWENVKVQFGNTVQESRSILEKTENKYTSQNGEQPHV